MQNSHRNETMVRLATTKNGFNMKPYESYSHFPEAGIETLEPVLPAHSGVAAE